MIAGLDASLRVPEILGAREKIDFQSVLHHPESAQEEYLLQQMVHPNRDCEFGREHNFGSIRTVGDYQRAVPVSDYECLRGRIERMAAGEAGVLVSEPVRHFFLTSGSTAAPKYVPVTNAFVRDKVRAFEIYWNSVYRRHPESGRGIATANFADSGRFSKTVGNIPCSSETAYWGRMTAATRPKSHFVVPRELEAIEDSDSRYYLLARLLLAEDLTLLMSLNPSTILLLLKKINEFANSLVRDLETGGLSADCQLSLAGRAAMVDRLRARPDRAEHIRQLLDGDSPRLLASDLWPRLKLIISWQSPVQRPYLDLLKLYVGPVPHDDYISMASEGILAIPVEGQGSGGVLAPNVHFYEFIPEEQAAAESPDVLLAHQLELNQNYVVVLSTSAGLYRYNIGDVVRVKGFVAATPLVEFLYRTGATCSMTGEKLTEAQVAGSVASVAREFRLEPTAFTAFPSYDGFPHYILLIELPFHPGARLAKAFISVVDQELGRQNIEYRSKRSSQRLGSPELWLMQPDGYKELRQRRVALGTNDEQIKPTQLSRDPDFYKQFKIAERIHVD